MLRLIFHILSNALGIWAAARLVPGIFFDGDADRGIIIDERGEIVFPDFMVALLAPEALKKYPGGKVYYDLRFSKVVKEIIEESGGIPIMMRVGNPFYKEKMMLPLR